MSTYQFIAVVIDNDGQNLNSEQFYTIQGCKDYFEWHSEREVFMIIDVAQKTTTWYRQLEKYMFVPV